MLVTHKHKTGHERLNDRVLLTQQFELLIAVSEKQQD